MFGLSEKNAVARATLKADGRDDSATISVWEYRIRQLRGAFGGTCQYQNIDDYITEAERPDFEEKNRLEAERQKAIVYKQSDTELSRHINYNE